MDNKTKKALLKYLDKDDVSNQELVTIIKKVEKEGDVDFLIPLAKILVKNEDELIQSNIKNIFLNVKRSNAPEKIIQILSDSYFDKEKKFFSSLCWELNLNFSPYIEQLLDFFILYQDLELALDMFSAIEETLKTYNTEFNAEQIDKLQEKLKNHISDFEHSKKLLAVELSHIFDEVKQLLKNKSE